GEPHARAQPPRDGGAQRQIADDLGVMRAAAIERGLGRLDDRPRGIEIGLAHGEDDDRLAAVPPAHGFGMDGPGTRAFAADAVGQTGEFHGARYSAPWAVSSNPARPADARGRSARRGSSSRRTGYRVHHLEGDRAVA